jgi:hypothetical protein
VRLSALTPCPAGKFTNVGLPHNVYLSRQALDIFVTLRTCSGGSRYVLPFRDDPEAPKTCRRTMRILASCRVWLKEVD